MCNCIIDIEKRFSDRAQEICAYKKPVERVSMRGIGYPIIDGKLLMKTCSDMEVTLTGQKKKETQKIFHNYCPFCGAKYDAA
jgi:hypothetical protein